ncbi:MAG: 3'-5' exonuclease [Verrucomicrobia bacterium]|nr:3'-5' exonuclease [Verrucomicrobiota bacterium]
MRRATEWTLIDTETTGLFAPIHVVEVAAVRMRGWEPTGETFQTFLDHDIEIPHVAEAVHGYDRAFLRRHGRAPREAHRAFRAFLGDRPICAHNLSYDLDRCLLPEWTRLQVGTDHARGFCTVKLARRTLSELKFHGMGLLTKKYGLTRAKAHAALADAQATAELVTKVFAPRLRGTAFEDFAELVRFSEMDRRRAVKALGVRP